MSTIVLILLGLFAAWWLLLIVHLVWNHFKDSPTSKTPLTPEQAEQLNDEEKRWRDLFPKSHMRTLDYLIAGLTILIFLPLYAYGWLVKPPDLKFDQVKTSQSDRK